MNLKQLLIIVVSLSFFACSDWFDVSPSTNIKQSELFRNEQGFRDVLTGAYHLISTPTLFGKELTFGYNDARVRYWHNSTSSVTHTYNKAHELNYTDAVETARFASIWSNMYKVISNLNGILDNIDQKKSVFSPGNYELIKGEALALRGFIHFEIMRFFSPSPALGNDLPAIPYYKFQTVVAQPQSTIGEVIAFVRSDLEAARQIMKAHDLWGPDYSSLAEDDRIYSDRSIRMNYWAVTGILARVELYAGNKNAALAAAKELIGEPDDSPKIPIALNTSGNPDQLFGTEMLFSLDVPTLKDIIDPYFSQDATAVNTPNGLFINTSYLSFYNPINPTDIEYRKDLWYIAATGTTSTLKKYTDLKRIPVIRVSELYFIAAEAAGGEIGFDYFNRIRAGRGLAPLDYSEDLTLRLKQEYMREFVGEGQLWYYYKRLGSTAYGGPVSSTLAITIDKYEVPLPVAEIEFGKVEQLK